MNAVAPLSFDDELCRRLLENMSEGVSLATTDGVIVYTNPAEERMYGYAPGELIGQHVSIQHALPPEENARLLGEVMATLASCGEWRGERRNRRKAGGEFYTRARISAVKVNGAVHWLCVQEDITDRRSEDADLKESEGRLVLAAAAARIGVWDWDLVTGEMVYSDRAKAICGLPAGQPVTYEMAVAVTHRQDFPRTSEQMRRALDPALRDDTPYEYRIVRPDGEVRWAKAHGVAVFAEGPEGPKAVRYVGTLEDITDQRLVEEELRQSRARLALAIEAGRMAVWSIEAGTEHFIQTPELNRILGFPEDAKPTLDDIRSRYAPGELDRMRTEVQAALQSGERFVETEFRYVWPNGALRWLLLRAEFVLTPSGDPAGATGVLIDITERKEAEDRLKLLAREVDHRANNLLTVVQATVALTRASSAKALKEILTGRISALAHAHQLLAQARWEGADLRKLVEEELRPFQLGQGKRVKVSGPTIALRPQAAQSVAMAMHELATNAAKYGALSKPEGQVEVAWRGGGEREPLKLMWIERGGPPVAQPAGRGLGMTVVERAVGGGLQGAARFDWRPEGLVCELEINLSSGVLSPAGEG
ncbi:PAS domain S-box protein [Phenylobacterium sp.]|jgi:PAS domain S-box-containing protein|uniref:PAS domain S-box protein n=1 Tax=Phenylobacterium sp. TaxID=1871053 RepID=UPI002E34088B|nr:PAS domain S-box protein [Phenylobacterium sp.]HEX2560360.1 PAS domain S-box protein [Phenylobacterium sp.]